MADSVERYIEESKRGGASAEEGWFTIDATAAREKLGRYRLPDPYLYILKLVQWAVASKASWVDIRISTKLVEVTHNGASVRGDDLPKLGEVMLGADQNRALSHLHIGLQAARLCGAGDVWLGSSEGWRCRLSDDNEVVEEKEENGEMQSVAIYSIKPRVCSARAAFNVIGGLMHLEPDAPLSFLKDVASMRRAEMALLRRHCGFTPIPVKLNGSIINRPFFGYELKTVRSEDGVLNSRAASTTTDIAGDKTYLVAPDYDEQLILAPASNWVGVSRWWQLRKSGDSEGTLLGVVAPSRLLLHRYLLVGYRGSTERLPALESHPAASPVMWMNGFPMLGCFAILGQNVGCSGIDVVHDGVVVAVIPHLSLLAVVSARELELDISGFAVANNGTLRDMVRNLEDWNKKKPKAVPQSGTASP